MESEQVRTILGEHQAQPGQRSSVRSRAILGATARNEAGPTAASEAIDVA